MLLGEEAPQVGQVQGRRRSKAEHRGLQVRVAQPLSRVRHPM
jgi:hypothetical protein